jgi:hypothetical protein
MSVASAIYNETCHICEVISQTLKKITRKIIIGRQYSANRIVAQQLIEMGEYRDESIESLTHKLNESVRKEWNI